VCILLKYHVNGQIHMTKAKPKQYNFQIVIWIFLHDVMSGTPTELSSFVVLDLVNNIQNCHDIAKRCFGSMLVEKQANGQIHMMNTSQKLCKFPDSSWNLPDVMYGTPAELSSLFCE